MKSFFTFVFNCILIPLSFGQQTYIPDNNFEEALIFEGLDTVLDDSIPTNIIDTLTFLNLEPFGITDLTGIEDFTALKSLICRNNNILQLDLSGNPFLEFVNCQNNSITNIDLTNCPNLETLFADDNELTSINLNQNPLLEKLILSQNGVSSINLQNNVLLKTLAMADNGITSIDLSVNDLLEIVDFTNNQLTTLDLSNLPNLVSLNVVNNWLTQLALSNNVNVEHLFVVGNDLTTLDLQNNLVLEYINCSYNNLTSLFLPPTNPLYNVSLGTLNNPNLYCIQSNDPAYVSANWNLTIDAFTQISNLCSSGIQEFEANLEIFPNPTENGWITINSSEKGNYRLLDIDGAQLQTGWINIETNSFDFSSFASGMYFMQFTFADRVISKRIEIL